MEISPRAELVFHGRLRQRVASKEVAVSSACKDAALLRPERPAAFPSYHKRECSQPAARQVSAND